MIQHLLFLLLNAYEEPYDPILYLSCKRLYQLFWPSDLDCCQPVKLFALDFQTEHQRICYKVTNGLEEGGGLITAGESSKSSDMLYSRHPLLMQREELISASASDSRDCKILFLMEGGAAIGKSSMSTEVGLAITRGFNADWQNSFEKTKCAPLTVNASLYGCNPVLLSCPTSAQQAQEPGGTATMEPNRNGSLALGISSLGAYLGGSRNLYAQGHPPRDSDHHNISQRITPFSRVISRFSHATGIPAD
ncbi:hypothetical protein AVEN_202756-1 [Araneus ventricosus]|uniref:Uncharacterized protein n=1 Tax=Araneus ventricosus TaxID=182803 RepID=A0A4Y2TIM8_ARAVE|nr:hypothetical protein AVEN_202756-1 [Araneus ventricosus]